MTALHEYAHLIDRKLNELIPAPTAGNPVHGEIPPLLAESMRYSLLAGGKRLRPAMLLATVDMLGGNRDEAMIPACALEMIHTYSLIHDDLPGMDDDSLRRGRPTSHVVFGVGQAILAGDALLSHAFELMLENALRYPDHAARQLKALNEIAAGAGARGMVAGQCLDLWCEQKQSLDGNLLNYIHVHKTARMLMAALLAGARLCDAQELEVDALTRFGRQFGLMFQAVDDILDAAGDAASMGKSTGKDARSGKLTYVSMHGLEGAKREVERLYDQAKAALSHFGGRAEFFEALLSDMAHRAC